MADATPAPASPAESGAPRFSFFARGKRIPANSFWLGYLPSALVVDGLVTWWFPGAGALYIAACRGLYWLGGYKTDKMLAPTAVNAFIEAVPILSALPGCSAFAAWTYLRNIAATKPPAGEESERGPTRMQQLTSLGAAYAVRRGERGRGGESPSQAAERAGTRTVGYEEKGRTGNGVVPPTSAADKNIGYQERQGRDRIPAAPGRNTDANVPYQRDRRERNKNLDGMVPPGGAPQSMGYQPRQPIFRNPPSSKPTPHQDQSVEYREAA